MLSCEQTWGLPVSVDRGERMASVGNSPRSDDFSSRFANSCYGVTKFVLRLLIGSPEPELLGSFLVYFYFHRCHVISRSWRKNLGTNQEDQ